MHLFFLFLFFTTCYGRYHSTEELLQKIRDECDLVAQLSCSDVNGILVVDYNKHLPYDQLYSFNEHGRERVTGELALKLIYKLKRFTPSKRVTIVPVLNIFGRKSVDQGHDCMRKNENGVDINRNFQMTVHHKYSRLSEEYEGEHSLSEKESRLIADLLKQGVKRYVNVHSGEFSLYSPYDSNLRKPKNYDTMTRNLQEWRKLCPVCKTGSAASVSSYKAYGTSVDYAINIGVPEAYTFEIYGGKGPSCKRIFNPKPQHMRLLLSRWLRIFQKVLMT